MGLRFRKSISILPGVKINLGKTGVSVSVGAKGIHHTIHSSGRRTSSIGIPGTGISYVKTTTGKGLFSSKDDKKEKKSSGGRISEAKKEENKEKVRSYNELLDAIRSIHEECSDTISWEEMASSPAPLYEPEEVDQGSLDTGIFSGIVAKYQNTVSSGRSVSKESTEYKEWEESKELAENILKGDIDSYLYVLSEFNPFEKITDFGSDFLMGTDDPEIVEVEFHAKTGEIVPTESQTVTTSGRLSEKAMSKTMYYDIVQDYICSCVIRTAREIFALLPVDKVAVHAVDKAGENMTEDGTVVSVVFDRDTFEKLNFSSIDPSDAIKKFNFKMNFKKTKGFEEVERVDF